jgi:hypothetical protein
MCRSATGSLMGFEVLPWEMVMNTNMTSLTLHETLLETP